MVGRLGASTGLDRAIVRSLSERSDAQGVAQLVQHGTLLAATGTCVSYAVGSLWLLPAMAVHGVVLAFLFAPLHESIHRTAFRSRPANASLAWLCGLALLIPPTDFRHFHWTHHRHTQDPNRDPELATPKPTTGRAYLLYLSGLPYWQERLGALIRQAGGTADQPYLPARAKPRVVLEARLFLAHYAAIALAAMIVGSTAPLTYWAIPVVLGQPALRAFLLAEHTGCPLVADMTRNTRTTLTTWLVRLLGWNMSYHAEHHQYPSVPFHALPRLHEALDATVECVSPGYRAAHRDIRAGLCPVEGSRKGPDKRQRSAFEI